MYSQLLGTAIDGTVDGTSSTHEALAHLLRCRSKLGAGTVSDGEVDGLFTSVADSLAYDAALIELARVLGIECDVRAFDQPQNARAGLEQAVVAHGIRLDERDEQSGPDPDRSVTPFFLDDSS